MSNIHTIYNVSETEEPGSYILDLELTDINGERYRCNYCSRADDNFGLAPAVRNALDAWIATSKPIAPYVPPTIEQVRAGMEPLSPRQLRLALVRSGVSLLSVTAALDALPEGPAKEEAEIEWEYATQFDRLAPALLTIADAIGLTPNEVDALWEQALTI